MQSEVDKIERYFSEAARIWPANPEMVLGREFFEMWERGQQPQPFTIDNVLTCGPFELEDEGYATAYMSWDFIDECPKLVLESDEQIKSYRIYFQDDGPEVQHPDIQEREEQGISYGERLECIMDILSWYREKNPGRSLQEIHKNEFLEGLNALKDRFSDQTHSVMKNMKIQEIRKLVRRATQDMAVDEQSDQLVLPLDGSYAGKSDLTSVIQTDQTFRSPAMPRTQWQINRDLIFLRDANHIISDLEETLIIQLADAEILSTEEQNQIVRITAETSCSLHDGEKLEVFSRGERKPVAHLKINVYDRQNIIATLRWPDQPEPLTPAHFAKLRRSPSEQIAQIMTAFEARFRQAGRFDSPALNAAMGVDKFIFEDGNPSKKKDLDSSQQRALGNAVSDKNPVVLIQGPPGTGKTHVLVTLIRQLCKKGKRILISAPSHTAVDNVCRRILDLPLLRLSKDVNRIAADVAESCWIGDVNHVHQVQAKKKKNEAIYAGTHVGVFRDPIIEAEIAKNGLFDVIIFDEAGMSRLDEFMICANLAKRSVLLGDHQQLPPFPLPDEAIAKIRDRCAATSSSWGTIQQSALEWLADQRQLPVFILHSSYRCQNPRLMRFSSTLFYNARVKASAMAEYYQLPYEERIERFPPASLRFYSTSKRPAAERQETLDLSGSPGFENKLECEIACELLYEKLGEYPLNEITIIAPYRKQIRLLRSELDHEKAVTASGKKISDTEWEQFLHQRIATVDSFQGGESDLVMISYVRSNKEGNVGFIDNPQRINVAHTRCRREMIIIGDLDHLAANGRERIFERMARAIARDGEIIDY